MTTRKFYRDGLEEEITGSIRVSTTSDGHTVERYRTSGGKVRFFVTLSGSHWTAHGDSLAEAVTDALWKDPSKRPSMDALVKTVKDFGEKRKITLNEFRVLTGACLTGCREAIARSGVKETELTAIDIRDKISHEWGDKLISVLGWS